MDGRRFDELTKALGGGASRRGMLKGALGGALAGIAARFGANGAAAQSRKRPDGATCVRDANCQSGVCDPQTRTCGVGGCPEFAPFCPGALTCCPFFFDCTDLGCAPPIITAAPATVYAALTESDALGAWAMDNDVEARVGHRFQLRGEPRGGFDGVMDAEIVELDPGRRIVFRWRGGDLVEPATVELTLRPAKGGQHTRLRVRHLSGQPEACAAATAVLGAEWQRRLLGDALPRYAAERERGTI